MKVLMGISSKEAVVGVTCWECKSRLFRVLVLPTFIYGTEFWVGNLKNRHWKVFKKGMKMHVMSHVKVCSSTSYHIIPTEFRELPIESYTLNLTFNNTSRNYPLLARQ